jgi:1,6-anhydro-N-acetylmuramate kinase
MSGTSADGIDAVVAEISGRGRRLNAKLLAHVHHGFSSQLRKKILHVCLHGKVDEICEMNFELGEHFARAALASIRKAKLTPKQITAIRSITCQMQSIRPLCKSASRVSSPSAPELRLSRIFACGTWPQADSARHWFRSRIGLCSRITHDHASSKTLAVLAI